MTYFISILLDQVTKCGPKFLFFISYLLEREGGEGGRWEGGKKGGVVIVMMRGPLGQKVGQTYHSVSE